MDQKSALWYSIDSTIPSSVFLRNLLELEEWKDLNETGYNADNENGLNENDDVLNNDLLPDDSDANDNKSGWEVSDFTSSDGSCGEWLPLKAAANDLDPYISKKRGQPLTILFWLWEDVALVKETAEEISSNQVDWWWSVLRSYAYFRVHTQTIQNWTGFNYLISETSTYFHQVPYLPAINQSPTKLETVLELRYDTNMDLQFYCYSPPSDVQDFNSRRSKDLNGNFDATRHADNKNQILNGRKWCAKLGRGPNVSKIQYHSSTANSFVEDDQISCVSRSSQRTSSSEVFIRAKARAEAAKLLFAKKQAELMKADAEKAALLETQKLQ
eukprot:gene879-10630_t